MPAFEGAPEVVYVSTHAAGRCRSRAGRPTTPIRNATRQDRLAFAVHDRAAVAHRLPKERPEVVVTTGAAPGLVALVLAKLALRQPDGLDRHRSPPPSGCRCRAGSRGRWPTPGWCSGRISRGRGARSSGARCCDLRHVGSMFPFDRLVRAMDAWAAAQPEEEVLAQIGDGGFEPRTCLGSAGWTGRTTPTATAPGAARRRPCRRRVGGGRRRAWQADGGAAAPRRQLGEHTSDHQVETVCWLRGKPGIHVADERGGPPACIAEAAGARPPGALRADRRPGLHRPPPSLHRRGLTRRASPGARGRSKPRPDARETSTGVFSPKVLIPPI